MKWSLSLGKIAGIRVYLHFTFLMVLVWIGLDGYMRRGRLEDALYGVLLILLVFAIVVLHELGHSLTARRYGIGTRDIILLPIGGVARLERMPRDPRQELIVALAGPAVNVVLLLGVAAALYPSSGLDWLSDLRLFEGGFLPMLAKVNLFLAVFNMLPAFPMDGGRVLRALLAMRLNYVLATQMASTIGQGMAMVFGLVGLLWNPFLIFIAFFVWIAAGEEASAVRIRSAMRGLPISEAMISEFRTLAPSESVKDAVGHLLEGFQQDFPVLHEGQLVGVLTRQDLIRALQQKGEMARVDDVMETDFQTAEPDEMMETVFQRLRDCSCRTLPIVQDDRLVGLVTMDHLGEFMMVQGAAHGRWR